MRSIPLLLILLTTIFSCNKTDQAETDAQLIQDYISANQLTSSKTDKGVYYALTERGEGTIYPDTFNTVTLHYSGYLIDNTRFDGTTPGNPVKFLLCEFIEGFRDGVSQFARGDKGTILIPSALAYGSRQVGPIPANSVLVFDIEIESVENEIIQDFITENEWDMTTTESGLSYQIVEAGVGENIPVNTDVTVRYSAHLFDGTVVKSANAIDGETLKVSAQTAGWYELLPLLKKEGVARAIFPAKLGYGSSGSGSVPQNATLWYEIEVVGF